MRLHAFLGLLLVGAGIGRAAESSSDGSDSKSLPQCSTVYRRCKCPAGATFKNLTSYGVIGAPAADVRNIMGNFLNITFQGGLVPVKTTGDGYKVGSTRTFNFSAPGGYYLVGERLTKYTAFPDGSFIQANEQYPSDRPTYIPGGGTEYGRWVIIEAQQTVVPNETAIAWKNWRCETGVTFPASASHEGGIANASAILGSLGQRTGVDIKPFSIYYEVRQD